MALTESRLRQIIREEAAKVMKEGPYSNRRDWGTMYDTGPGARAREEYWKDQDRRDRGAMGYDEPDDDDDRDAWDDDEDLGSRR